MSRSDHRVICRSLESFGSFIQVGVYRVPGRRGFGVLGYIRDLGDW